MHNRNAELFRFYLQKSKLLIKIYLQNILPKKNVWAKLPEINKWMDGWIVKSNVIALTNLVD